MPAVGSVTELAPAHWSALDFRCGRTAYRRLAGVAAFRRRLRHQVV